AHKCSDEVEIAPRKIVCFLYLDRMYQLFALFRLWNVDLLALDSSILCFWVEYRYERCHIMPRIHKNIRDVSEK
ncbi:hypothetical protein PENTCL1PPCAC_8116, partial [Pristionchus entomophagus]